jgi:hypothetical protein
MWSVIYAGIALGSLKGFALQPSFDVTYGHEHPRDVTSDATGCSK